jgi:biotin carboxyl carrier protein
VEERLRIGERSCAVAARETEPGRLRLEIDGIAEEVRLVASSDGCHLVEVGGALETLFAVRSPRSQESGAGTWVWHRGRARLVEPEPRERASPARRAAASLGAVSSARARLPPGAITPPTPAIVVAVLVEPGQAVAQGQALLVVSAMKMESQLASPFAGRVKSVNTQVGAKVRPGEILVEIEIQPEGGRHGG